MKIATIVGSVSLGSLAIILVVVFIGTKVIKTKKAPSEKRPDKARIYVIDRDGICRAANRGYIQKRRSVIRTGFGRLLIHNPVATLILEKETSDNRVSKILQIKMKHCVRVDK